MKESANTWYLYLLRCADGSLYTGITTDVQRRLQEHGGDGEGGSRRGAKALRGRLPVSLAFSSEVGDRSRALQLEYRVKQLSKQEKEALVSQTLSIDSLTAG